MEAWIQIVRDGGPVALLAVGAVGARWTLGRIEAMQERFLSALAALNKELADERKARLEDARTYAVALTEAANKLQDALDRRRSERPSSR